MPKIQINPLIAISLLVLAALVAFFAGRNGLQPQASLDGGGAAASQPEKRFTPHNDPPILASGGSMTFRLRDGPWTCDTDPGNPHQQCLSDKVGVGQVALVDADWDSKPADDPFKPTLPWSIDLFVRDRHGTAPKVLPEQQADGSLRGKVTICTTQCANVKIPCSCGSGTQSDPQYKSKILILVSGLSVGGSGRPALVDSPTMDDTQPPPGGQTVVKSVQYFDSKCESHNEKSLEACEHPGRLQVAIEGKQYGGSCHRGHCRVEIGMP